MRLLLDTHALLWWFTDDPRLSDKLRTLVGDMSNEILVSSACAWEISTKHAGSVNLIMQRKPYPVSKN